VLAWRRRATIEFLLVHPGGPFWAGKDEAAWSIPKGLVEAGEADWAAAAREFREELGLMLGEGAREALAPCRTPGGKIVQAWLVEADLDVSQIVSNTFEIEWPPRSGRRAAFPEVDRAAWFDAAEAAQKIHAGQRPILADALERLSARES
jgi:predicted NUDIX family NTP pyrophosphohydrolase